MSHLTEQDLYQLLEGTVTDQQRVALEAHLLGCADCREWAGESAETLEELQTFESQENQAQANESQAGASTQQSPRAAQNPATWRWIAPIVAAAALASVLILQPFGESTNRDAEIWATIASAGVPPEEIPMRVRAATGSGSLPSVTEEERYFWLGAAVTELERARRQADMSGVVDQAQTIRQLLDGPIETQPVVGLYEAIQKAAEQGTLSDPDSAELNLQADQMLRERVANPHYELGRELEWLRLQLAADLTPASMQIPNSDAYSDNVREQLEQLARTDSPADLERLLQAVHAIRAEYGG